MKIDNGCLNSIIDAAAYGSDQAKLLFFVRSAIKLYSDECRRSNLLSLMGLNTALGPFEMAKSFVSDSISEKTAKSLLNSAVDQLGERFIYSTVRNAASEAIEGVMNQSAVKNTIETARNIQKAMFSLTAISLTASNDMILELAKTTAKRMLEHVETKKELLREMRDVIRKINNAIKLLEVKSFQDQWKTEMLDARNNVYEARIRFIDVYSTLAANRGFKSSRYYNGRKFLDSASDILTPKKVDGELSGKMDNQGIIWNGAFEKATGLEVNEEQKNAVISIPKLSADLASYIDDYIEITEKINPLVRNYQAAFSNLKKASGGKLTEWQLRTLDSVINKLGETLEDMDRSLLKDQSGISSTGYSLNSYEWLLNVQTTIETLKTMQPEVLEELDESNLLLNEYNNSVKILSSTDRLSTMGGKVFMDCPNSAEEYEDIIAQLGAILVQSQRFFIGKNTVDNFTDLVVVTDARLKLSQELLAIIESAVTPFTLLDSPLKENVNNLIGFMDDLGFDRAKDLLVSGDYEKFFSMTDKNVTYVGAALSCLRSASKCAKDQQVKNELDLLILALNRYQKNKFLEASRVINSGRKRQTNRLLNLITECDNMQSQADRLSEKDSDCDASMSESNMLDSQISTKEQVESSGGFDIKSQESSLEEPPNRQDIIDGEILDFNQLLDIKPTTTTLVNLIDRKNEINEVERNISLINKSLSDPPTSIELDQLAINQNLADSLNEHVSKYTQAINKLQKDGFNTNSIDTVGIIKGQIMQGFKNGNIVYEVNNRGELKVNLKVILPGS